MKQDIYDFVNTAFQHPCFHDIDSRSNKLLDFTPPAGLACELSKKYNGSVHFRLKLPQEGSLGFLYTNSNFLCGTRLDRGGSIDVIGAYSHSSKLINIISNNYLHFQTLYSIKPNWTVSLIYSKEPGFNTLFTLPLKGLAPWTAKIGGEVFYSPSERAGGMSLGGSLTSSEKSREEYVLVVNPIMGDASLSYTLGIREKIEASTKFKFNRFSLESDLSLGILFKSMQIRLDSRGLLRLKWELPLQNMRIIFGIETEVMPKCSKSQAGKSAFGLTIEL